MICRVCGERYAPFPKKDWHFIKGKGFFPRHSQVERKRQKLWQSDEKGVCSPECDEQSLVAALAAAQST